MKKFSLFIFLSIIILSCSETNTDNECFKKDSKGLCICEVGYDRDENGECVKVITKCSDNNDCAINSNINNKTICSNNECILAIDSRINILTEANSNKVSMNNANFKLNIVVGSEISEELSGNGYKLRISPLSVIEGQNYNNK